MVCTKGFIHGDILGIHIIILFFLEMKPFALVLYASYFPVKGMVYYMKNQPQYKSHIWSFSVKF